MASVPDSIPAAWFVYSDGAAFYVLRGGEVPALAEWTGGAWSELAIETAPLAACQPVLAGALPADARAALDTWLAA